MNFLIVRTRHFGLYLLAILLLFLKSPDAILTPQFWAEDGPVFFAPQFFQSWPLFVTPYAGYLHTVTRLIAWLASLAPPVDAPLLYNVSAIAIDAFCIAFVTIRMSAWFPFWVVFSSFFIVPNAGDIFGTVTNVQWFMQFALVAACLLPKFTGKPSSLALRTAGRFVLALAALSGPFSILVAFLCVGLLATNQLFKNVDAAKPSLASNLVNSVRRLNVDISRPNLGIIALCATMQLVVLSLHKARTPVEEFMLSAREQTTFGVANMESFYFKTVNNPFTAFQLADLTSMMALALICLFLLARRPRVWNSIACLFLAIGAAQPILAFAKQRELHTLAATSHYFFMLSVVCCWIGWQMLDDLVPRWRMHAALALSACFFIGVFMRPYYFCREPLHDLKWPDYAKQIRHDQRSNVVVPVNPAPWRLVLHAM